MVFMAATHSTFKGSGLEILAVSVSGIVESGIVDQTLNGKNY